MQSLDLFCGPGGISEGLRMAGITTRFAVDHARDACNTFALNHPEAEVHCADVLTIRPSDLPDADVIVGGPPCVNFSTSKGSRANVLDGLRLVQWFLRVVAEKRPRFWIMENVPRVANHIPEKIPYSWLGLDHDGVLPVPTRLHFNTAEFGVAQARNRYLIGNYPVPQKTHLLTPNTDLFSQGQQLHPCRTLGEMIQAFPSPLTEHMAGQIIDPNYGTRLSIKDLTDHFIDTTLTDEEAEDIRNDKTKHPYMGRMAFPDDLNRPARTVVATQLGRETLVIASGNGVYRRATIRECATIQSFPICYQFTGNSIGSRYRQAGDAVPPLLGFEIARLITGVSEPILRKQVIRCSEPLKRGFAQRTKRVTFNPKRKFAQMIPGKEIRGSRVELDNLNLSRGLGQCIEPTNKGRIWAVRLHVGEGKHKARSVEIGFAEILGTTTNLLTKSHSKELRHWVGFLKDIINNLPTSFDVNAMQEYWSRNEDGSHSPMRLAKQLSEVVDRNFPRDSFADSKLPVQLHGLQDDVARLRVRLVAAAIAGSAVIDHLYGDTTVVSVMQEAVLKLEKSMR